MQRRTKLGKMELEIAINNEWETRYVSHVANTNIRSGFAFKEEKTSEHLLYFIIAFLNIKIWEKIYLDSRQNLTYFALLHIPCS